MVGDDDYLDEGAQKYKLGAGNKYISNSRPEDFLSASLSVQYESCRTFKGPSHKIYFRFERCGNVLGGQDTVPG